jgi:hypothetical protein
VLLEGTRRNLSKLTHSHRLREETAGDSCDTTKIFSCSCGGIILALVAQTWSALYQSGETDSEMGHQQFETLHLSLTHLQVQKLPTPFHEKEEEFTPTSLWNHGCAVTPGPHGQNSVNINPANLSLNAAEDF